MQSRREAEDTENRSWLALAIGNSRMHWAWFVGETLQQAWDTEYLPASVVNQLARSGDIGEWPTEIFPPSLMARLTSPPNSAFRTSGDPPGRPYDSELQTPKRQSAQRGEPPHAAGSSELRTPNSLYLASVVPSQTALWQTYPNVHVMTLEQLPLRGLYPTLGIDRALALLGAGENWGWPVLAIDAGTALTFTGADAERQLVGGAILPGLGLQLRSLARGTAALPLVETPLVLPPRWASDTPTAIQSGVVYTLLAGIKDFIEAWWQKFPGSRLILKGGDRTLLLSYLQHHFPEIAAKVIADPHLIFWGMRQQVMSRGDPAGRPYFQ